VKRRLLALVVASLLVACGFVLWSHDPLTSGERPFLGTWLSRGANRHTMTFTADHQVFFPAGAIQPTQFTGEWRVRNGKVYFDYEPSRLRRALRPLLAWFGVAMGPVLESDTTNFDLDGSNPDALFVRASRAD
jgi:hypothetical protein